jgi:glutamate/aspartate transport system substrate-binding protein
MPGDRHAEEDQGHGRDRAGPPRIVDSVLYYDHNQQVVGYSRDFQMKVVDAVKKLKLPNLQVKNIPVTSQNRIPLVQNGTVDIECGSTTNNLERQQQAAFSDTIFVIGTR